MLSHLKAGATCREPACALLLMGEGEDLRNPRVPGKEFFEQDWAVTFAAAMQQQDVPREAIGAAGGEGAVEDFLDGGEGLVVGEVSRAAHDAIFEKPGSRGVLLHVVVVIGFEGEYIDAAEAFDEGVGDMAEVGGEADAVPVAGEEKSVGALGIVGQGEGAGGNTAEGLEGGGVIEADEQLIERNVRDVLGLKLILGVEGFAGGAKLAGIARRAKEANAVLEKGLVPIGIKVVVVEVGEEDGLEVGEFDAGAGESLRGGAGPEAGIDEERAPGSTDEGGVAGGAAAEHAQFKGHPCLRRGKRGKQEVSV